MLAAQTDSERQRPVVLRAASPPAQLSDRVTHRIRDSHAHASGVRRQYDGHVVHSVGGESLLEWMALMQDPTSLDVACVVGWTKESGLDESRRLGEDASVGQCAVRPLHSQLHLCSGWGCAAVAYVLSAAH